MPNGDTDRYAVEVSNMLKVEQGQYAVQARTVQVPYGVPVHASTSTIQLYLRPAHTTSIMLAPKYRP